MEKKWYNKLLDALMANRMRQAEREIALYVAKSGGKFTDEMERHIETIYYKSPSK